MMPLKWCFKFLILIFHEARRFKDLQGNMASVLIRYTEVAMTMALINSEGKSYKLSKE